MLLYKCLFLVLEYLLFLGYPFYLYLFTHISYVTFNTDINMYSKKKTILASTLCISTYLSLIMLGLRFLSECENEQHTQAYQSGP